MVFGLFGPIGIPELAIILVLALVIFGAGKLSGVGKALGTSVKEFKESVQEEEKEKEEKNKEE